MTTVHVAEVTDPATGEITTLEAPTGEALDALLEASYPSAPEPVYGEPIVVDGFTVRSVTSAVDGQGVEVAGGDGARVAWIPADGTAPTVIGDELTVDGARYLADMYQAARTN